MITISFMNIFYLIGSIGALYFMFTTDDIEVTIALWSLIVIQSIYNAAGLVVAAIKGNK
jgi:hypothetical protein